MTNMNETILASLTAAKNAKKRLGKVSEKPKAEHSGFMASAVLLAFDLTVKEWVTCKEYLLDNSISQGTVNAVSRFTAGNPGHDKLAGLLQGGGDTLESRLEHLTGKHITTYVKLQGACIIPSEDSINKKLAKQLANLSSKRQAKIVAKANKIRLDGEAEEQKKDMTAKQVAVAKLSTKPRKKAVNE